MARTERSRTLVNMKHVEQNLELLKEGNRLREAICLCYQTFVNLAMERFKKDRPRSTTFREFAMDIVKEGVDPGLIYPFTTVYEEIRFGRRPSSQTTFMDAHKMMKRLEEELQSKSLSPQGRSTAAST